MKNKKVLDLGYGEGEFVKGLIEKGTTQEAYGVDEGSREVEADNAAEGHFFQGDFEKPLPVHDVDYVVSVGAVSLGISGTEKIMNIEAILENALAALKEKGEIRIYPIQEPAIANFYAHLDESRKTWEETVHEFAKSHGAEYSFVPRDILVTGYKNDVF
ncbi:MAG: class I SAM-dependent methyltransferase [bacterium]